MLTTQFTHLSFSHFSPSTAYYFSLSSSSSFRISAYKNTQCKSYSTVHLLILLWPFSIFLHFVFLLFWYFFLFSCTSYLFWFVVVFLSTSLKFLPNLNCLLPVVLFAIVVVGVVVCCKMRMPFLSQQTIDVTHTPQQTVVVVVACSFYAKHQPTKLCGNAAVAEYQPQEQNKTAGYQSCSVARRRSCGGQ